MSSTTTTADLRQQILETASILYPAPHGIKLIVAARHSNMGGDPWYVVLVYGDARPALPQSAEAKAAVITKGPAADTMEGALFKMALSLGEVFHGRIEVVD